MEDISNILKMGESDTLEFKKSTSQLENALKSICAFLNHRGGAVYFGIAPDKKSIGQDVTDQTLKSISQKIRQRIKPEIIPEIKVVGDKGKGIITVKVHEGHDHLYYLDGIPYKRVGTENVIIPPNEIEKIILEKKRVKWDEQVCEKAALNEIDNEKMRWFLQVAREERNLAIPENASLKVILLKLNLLREEKLTNAAVLLFGKNPQQYFIQAKVKGIRFKGTKPIKPFLDMKVFGGTIIDQIDSVKRFVVEHMPKAVWLAGNIQREEKYQYPLDALREGIVNALCHRDYESVGETHVRIFDDRIEIWNPGLLPDPLKLEDLKKEHKSIPRNPLIAEQLFWIKYIEKIGSGTNDMINYCRLWGIPEPEFKHVTGDFVVVFRGERTEEYWKKKDLNERQIRAVVYLTKKGEIDNKTYRQINNVGKVISVRELNDLVVKKIVKVVGAGRSTKYKLND